MQVNQPVKIISGKYAGLVGTVEEVRSEKGTAKVEIKGVFNGENIDVEHWFGVKQLEDV